MEVSKNKNKGRNFPKSDKNLSYDKQFSAALLQAFYFEKKMWKWTNENILSHLRSTKKNPERLESKKKKKKKVIKLWRNPALIKWYVNNIIKLCHNWCLTITLCWLKQLFTQIINFHLLSMAVYYDWCSSSKLSANYKGKEST